SELTVGFAGALLPHKGVHILLEAIARLGWKRTRVRLAGPVSDSSYQDVLRAAAIDLNVEFTGTVASAEMPRFLRTLDILVLPSLWPENLPFIMLEAHAGNVPVIASRLAGVKEQIGQENLLFEPGSADALARALEWWRLHPRLAVAEPVLS